MNCSSLNFWGLKVFSLPYLLEAAPVAEPKADGALVLAGVLLSLVVIYFASKLGGEICLRLNLPPVLGELIGGVLIGISALKLLVFPEAGSMATDSLVMQFLESTSSLTYENAEAVFRAQSEVISVLAELGVVILLLEIGLESDLQELIRVGPQAAVVAVVGVVAPFVAGTVGLVYLFGVPGNVPRSPCEPGVVPRSRPPQSCCAWRPRGRGRARAPRRAGPCGRAGNPRPARTAPPRARRGSPPSPPTAPRPSVSTGS